MPFVTSELYQALGHAEQLALAPWPTGAADRLDDGAEADFARLQAAVGAVRSLRGEADLAPTAVITVALTGEGAALVAGEAEVFESLARARLAAGPAVGPTISLALPGLSVSLPLGGQVDVTEYRARQERRLAKLEEDLERSRKKLANARFVAAAPAEVVEEERRRVAERTEVSARLREVLAQIGAEGAAG